MLDIRESSIPHTDRLLLVADFAGSTVFAAEAALTAIAAGLDLFGVMALGFTTAFGGGVIRDLLIDARPPQALRDPRYAAVVLVTASLVFLFVRGATAVPSELIVTLDAAGLAFFAIAGTEKALACGLPLISAVFLGMITGVGGGTLRDVLLARVPIVLRADVYATAACAGAVALIAAKRLGASPMVAGLAGGTVCFVLRLVSVWQHWNLPRAS